MNKVILTGNLCRDIEVKKTQNGNSVVTNCVAVSRDRKEQDGTYKSDFINIVVWSQAADYLGNYARKGDRVELIGRWNVRTYENNGGVQTVNECVVESIKVFNSQSKAEPEVKQETKNERAEQNTSIVDSSDDDLPF